ncbi:glycosyltransferase family 4 protein [Paraburkholderia bannensis]|uniref:glycosyltransferase family 4 protein n=1 Tax=Paraburkholderia bannensis TaxID=765414 RepID=UPI002AC32E1A|nr:glycosyltransferase family 1 protein [Paraburkholderia bannensis]
MRIVLDMQGAQTESRYRGIGRYTMNFSLGVARNRGPHEVLVALSGLFPESIEPIRAAFEGILPQENIRVWHAPGPVRELVVGDDVRRHVAELAREAFIASLQPDVVHICSLFEDPADNSVASINLFDRVTPVTVSFYDLIPFLNPNQYFAGNAGYEKYYRRRLEIVQHAGALLAISEYARQEGIEHLGLPEDRIINASTAIEPKFRPLDVDQNIASQLLKKFGIDRKFILYTGGSDGRKNLPRLIQAYGQLPEALQREHQLLFAGRILQQDIDNLQGVARAAGLSRDALKFTGYISDEDLVYLFNLCHLFVFPSWHEGFGLPILEAMACGAPSIGSNTSSLPEVIGLADAMFDPLDVTAISDKMAQVLQDQEMRTRLREHGLEQAKKFSWDETARRSIAVWERLESDVKSSWAERSTAYERLMKAIAGHLPGAGEDYLNSLAHNLALNQQSGIERQLLVDVSRDRAGLPAAQVESLDVDTLERLPRRWRVEPVYATPKGGYRYARASLGLEKGSDTPIQWQRGDVFVGFDDPAAVPASQRALRRQLESDGVSIELPGDSGSDATLASRLTDYVGRVRVKRQLLVDVSELVQRDGKSGIQRVVRNILSAWLHHAPEDFKVEPVYATTERNSYRYARRFAARMLGKDDESLEDAPVDFAPGDVFVGLDLQLEVVTAQHDFYQMLRRLGVTVKFVIYDLLCIQIPEYFSDEWRDNFERWLGVVAETDGAVCISRSVAGDLTKWIAAHNQKRARSFKIDWFHLGADVDNRTASTGMPQDAASVLAKLRDGTTFLMVGTVEPRKGHAQVLSAFEQLWDAGVAANLVIVGKQGWSVDELAERLASHTRKDSRLFWISDASDAYLAQIYDGSKCLIAASYGEGYGLPLIEGARHGLSLFVRDIPVFREVATDHAYYFKSADGAGLATEIREWLALHGDNKNPKPENMPFLTWQQSADDLAHLLST